MGLSDFPHPFVAVVLLADSQRGPRRHSGPNAGPPGSRVCLFRACTGSQTTQGRNNSCDDDLFRVAFRAIRRRRPPKLKLNTQPTRCPVNASPLPSRTATHDSGPTWFVLQAGLAPARLTGLCRRTVWSKYSNAQRVSSLHLPKGRLNPPSRSDTYSSSAEGVPTSWSLPPSKRISTRLRIGSPRSVLPIT